MNSVHGPVAVDDETEFTRPFENVGGGRKPGGEEVEHAHLTAQAGGVFQPTQAFLGGTGGDVPMV